MDKREIIKKITDLQRELVKTMRRHTFKHWLALSLTTSQVKSLFCIIESKKISSRKLADMLEVTPANVTGIIDRLIEHGLARRVGNSQDRRVFFLEATEAGKKLIESLEQHATEKSAKMLSGLSEAELEHLHLGLAAFLKATRAQIKKENPID